MAVLSEEYQSLVLDDLKTYVGLTHPLRSNIITRLVIRKMSLGKLHPNPDDEFSMPEIGPSYEIVSNYSNQFRFAINTGVDPIKEPDYRENVHRRIYAVKRTSQMACRTPRRYENCSCADCKCNARRGNI